MNSILKNSIILVFMTVGINTGYGQKPDSVFYSDSRLRSVAIHKDKDIVFVKFFSQEGENLLDKNSFHYEYPDSAMQLKRVVDVENRKLKQEFWVSDTDTIYNEANFDPSFEENIVKFYKYISRKLEYPTQALNERIQGKVILSFIVDKKGIITQAKATTTLGYGLENAAIQLLNKYSKWGIVTLNSKAVNCYFTLPIAYTFD